MEVGNQSIFIHNLRQIGYSRIKDVTCVQCRHLYHKMSIKKLIQWTAAAEDKSVGLLHLLGGLTYLFLLHPFLIIFRS